MIMQDFDAWKFCRIWIKFNLNLYLNTVFFLKQEFYKPMKNNGLLTCEQLDVIFQNLEELIDVNKQFTDRLQQAVDAAINAGDEVNHHLCIVLYHNTFITPFHKFCIRNYIITGFLIWKRNDNFWFYLALKIFLISNDILEKELWLWLTAC